LNSEIARIHREGVKLELEQLGLTLGDKYSQEWFEKAWGSKYYIAKTVVAIGEVIGFYINFKGEPMLYVHPSHRREGVGSRLLHGANNAWVINGNKIAESFYLKNGFVRTGEQRESVIFDHEITENLWERG